MNTTLNDIARLANVSPSTVSRVIAGNPRISRETRDRVLKIMADCNYHPNIIARSLASKSTNIVGVVIPETTEKAFQHPFYPEILRGIASMAHKLDYHILISNATDVSEETKVINKFVKGHITDGLILMTSKQNDPIIAELTQMNFPFVIVGRPVRDEKINWVDNDNVNVSYELTKHILQQGRKKIAFLGLSPQYVVTTDRLQGYRQALAEFGIPFDENLIVEGRFIDDTGYDLMKLLFEKDIRPDGVIACDDLLAFGAVKLIKERGLKVPGDIAVAGYNNVPMSDYFSPSLTSVEVMPYNLGVSAFELLAANLKSDTRNYNRTIVPAQIIRRNSTRIL
jgi:DNA-binding LacI/PurR family transcriptional regulator